MHARGDPDMSKHQSSICLTVTRSEQLLQCRRQCPHLPAGRWAAIPTRRRSCRERSLQLLSRRSGPRYAATSVPGPMATWRQCRDGVCSGHFHPPRLFVITRARLCVAVSTPDSPLGAPFPARAAELQLAPVGGPSANTRSCPIGIGFVRLSTSDLPRHATRTPTSDVPTPPGALSEWTRRAPGWEGQVAVVRNISTEALFLSCSPSSHLHHHKPLLFVCS
jgi:hypothetical protein